MVVTRVAEIGAGKRGTSLNDYYVRTYERFYRLYMDGPLSVPDGPALVAAGLLTPPLPQVWDQHPTDPLALVKAIDCKEEETPDRWIATVRYGSDPTDITRQHPNPLMRPPDVSWDSEDYEEALEADAAGNPLVNGAGDYFDPPPTARKTRLLLQVEQNFAAFDEHQASTNLNKTNSAPFLGYAINQVFLRKMAGKRDFSNNLPFWRVSFAFAIGDDALTTAGVSRAWQYRPLDQGRFYLPGGGAVRRRFTDGQGHVLESGLLNGVNGDALIVGGAAVFLAFTVIGQADFNLLGISLNF